MYLWCKSINIAYKKYKQLIIVEVIKQISPLSSTYETNNQHYIRH